MSYLEHTEPRSLKSVLVLLAQILGPFGPPKKRVNFDMFKKHQKCVLCILTPNHLTIINYCCPTVLYSINKAASISSGIYFVPLASSAIKFFGPPKCLWSSKHACRACRFQGPGTERSQLYIDPQSRKQVKVKYKSKKYKQKSNIIPVSLSVKAPLEMPMHLKSTQKYMVCRRWMLFGSPTFLRHTSAAVVRKLCCKNQG